jgi:hypothetical protein
MKKKNNNFVVFGIVGMVDEGSAKGTVRPRANRSAFLEMVVFMS